MALPSGKVVFMKEQILPRKKDETQHKTPYYERTISEHYLNHCVDLVLPGCSSASEELLCRLSDSNFCLLEALPVSELINHSFINAFVKTGRVYMLSQNTNIDTDDCVALLPTGHLVLNLTKDTYTSLGLEGTVSCYHRRHKDKYVVKVPVTADYFKPGKKFYERVKWCLEKQPDFKFTFLATWEPNDDTVCSSSLASYFRRHRDVVCHDCRYRATRHERKYLAQPSVTYDGDTEAEHSCGGDAFYEWLGGCVLRCDDKSDSYISTVTCPEPARCIRDNVTYSVRGMVSSETVHDIVDTLRCEVNDSSPARPWAAVTVHGFQDAVLSWRHSEHGYYASGDNSYTIVLFPGDKFWVYQSLGAHDTGT